MTGKIRRPQFEPHVGIKMAQVQGSPVYMYALFRAGDGLGSEERGDGHYPSHAVPIKPMGI